MLFDTGKVNVKTKMIWLSGCTFFLDTYEYYQMLSIATLSRKLE